jgi:hypothetical protein
MLGVVPSICGRILGQPFEMPGVGEYRSKFLIG